MIEVKSCLRKSKRDNSIRASPILTHKFASAVRLGAPHCHVLVVDVGMGIRAAMYFDRRLICDVYLEPG